MERGNCYVGLHSPGRYFPPKGASTAPARSGCSGCPVTDECLEYALVMRIDDGFFGGRSARERARIRRDRGMVNPRYSAAASERRRPGLPWGPLDAVLTGRGITKLDDRAAAVGYTRRAVTRWRDAGQLPMFSAGECARRLGLTVEQIWPRP